ncbi:hypothetical protein [Paenibacillus sp. A14]|uniref:hypothetical protein n=1 Tax=Paenibacillus sp. A14 TaxID=3119820 RepID=UPI002FE26D73
MSIAGEISGLTELIQAKFPAVTVHRFQGPALPVAGEFVIELKQETRRSDSRSHTLAERQYAVVYYAEQVEEVVLSLEALSRYLMNERAEADTGKTGGAGSIRAESFAISTPEKLEGGLHKGTGTVVINTREPVAIRQYEKINKVEYRTTINLKGGMNE